MKKILGISLCALFAVSAANADIASKDYVDGLVGGIDTDAIATNTSNITALTTRVGTNETNITNNTNAITALQATAEGLGALATKDSVATGDINDGAIMNADINDSAAIAPTKIAFTTQQTAALNSGITSESVNKIDANADAITDIDSSMTALSGRVTQNETDIDSLQATAQGLGALATKDSVATGDINDGAIMNADINDSAAIAPTKIAFSTQQTAALSSGIDSTKVGQIATNTGSINSLNGSVTALEGRVGTNEGNISTLTEKVEAMNAESTTGQYVKYVKQENGKVIAEGTSFDTSVSDTSNNAPTSKAVAGYVATNAVQTVVAGETNGTIVVDNQEVAIPGLQAMAYKATVTNTDITDETITNADISPTAAILSSKISFTREQANALDSGITSTLVGKITANESAIGENATNIGNNARNITSMGEKVTQNTNKIANLSTGLNTANEKIQNNTTAISSNTNTLGSIVFAQGNEACAESADGCTLVLSSTGYKWEAVKR